MPFRERERKIGKIAKISVYVTNLFSSLSERDLFSHQKKQLKWEKEEIEVVEGGKVAFNETKKENCQFIFHHLLLQTHFSSTFFSLFIFTLRCSCWLFLAFLMGVDGGGRRKGGLLMTWKIFLMWFLMSLKLGEFSWDFWVFRGNLNSFKDENLVD